MGRGMQYRIPMAKLSFFFSHHPGVNSSLFTLKLTTPSLFPDLESWSEPRTSSDLPLPTLLLVSNSQALSILLPKSLSSPATLHVPTTSSSGLGAATTLHGDDNTALQLLFLTQLCWLIQSS